MINLEIDAAVDNQAVREDERELELAGREKIRRAIQINDSEIERIEAEVRRLRYLLDQRAERGAYLNKIEQLLKQTEKTARPEGDQASGLKPRKRERRTSLAWIVRREAILSLRKVSRPLDRRELLQEFRAAQVPFKSDDEDDILQSITKIMWDAPEFISTKEGYWLADEPLPKR